MVPFCSPGTWGFVTCTLWQYKAIINLNEFDTIVHSSISVKIPSHVGEK